VASESGAADPGAVVKSRLALAAAAAVASAGRGHAATVTTSATGQLRRCLLVVGRLPVSSDSDCDLSPGLGLDAPKRLI
jgi:hypothetical protein